LPSQTAVIFRQQPQFAHAGLAHNRHDLPLSRYRCHVLHYHKPLGPVIDEKAWKLEISSITLRAACPLQDALHPHNLLCCEMNGAPLSQPHGFPLRLIAPDWYGIANIKGLQRIDVRETRFMGPWMAREYVTLRQELQDGDTVWMETSVYALVSAPPRPLYLRPLGTNLYGGLVWCPATLAP
jgi:hypothetical protein